MPELQRPQVVVITADQAQRGSWARKVAAVLESAGAGVTIVARSATGARSITRAGSVQIIRAPDRGVLRKHNEAAHAGRRTAVREAALRLLAYPSREASLHASARRTVWERENATEIARLRTRISRWADRGPVGKTVRLLLWGRIRARQRLLLLRRAAHARRVDNSGRLESSATLQHLERILAVPRMGAGWRSTLPEAHDLELALGPVLDQLQPDVIHACGYLTAGVAERARVRARARNDGGQVWLVYDARDDLSDGAPSLDPQRLRAAQDLEREYVPVADRVLAAWPQVAERLRLQCRPGTPPAVLFDTPAVAEGTPPKAMGLRQTAGLPDDQRLLVHTGSLADDSVETLTRALPSLADAHLVFPVPSPQQAGSSTLLTLADELGCGGRVHLVERSVPDLAASLPDASLGIPGAASEPDCYFRLLQAGLPLVVSRAAPAAALTERSGVGELFTPGDPDSLAAAVTAVLADRDRYRAACRKLIAAHGWPRQAETLVEVYRGLLGDAVGRPGQLTMADERSLGSAAAEPASTFTGLLGIGPRNGNGQAWAWSEALRRAYPSVRTEVFTAEFPTGRLDMAFPCDVSVSLQDWKSLDWQLAWAAHVLRDFSHLLLEQGLTAVGRLNGRHFHHDLPMLRQHGISVALVFRGSEIRDPGRHAAREPYSPFADPGEELTAVLQAQVDELRPHVEAFDGPKFVTTPDLLDDVPDATWLPQVLDLEFWAEGPEVLKRSRPVVVHAPSKERMKGSRHVDEICQPLAERGVIEYRRLRGIPYSRMPAVISAADIVVDQFALGSYGVLALQALATGRLVIGNVSAPVRGRVPMRLPIVQADPSTFADVLHGVLADPDRYRDVARSSRRYVGRFHDGSYSARQLAPFLGLAGAHDAGRSAPAADAVAATS